MRPFHHVLSDALLLASGYGLDLLDDPGRYPLPSLFVLTSCFGRFDRAAQHLGFCSLRDGHVFEFVWVVKVGDYGGTHCSFGHHGSRIVRPIGGALEEQPFGAAGGLTVLDETVH